MAHILLVDDDPDILSILSAVFESAGHRVLATPDPVGVGDLAREHRLDAVVLDVMMPRRSGWEVLEELRSEPRNQRLPVLMLSAIGDASNRVRGIRLGADDFVAKPFHPEEVLARVEALVDRRSSEVPGLQGELAVVPVSEVLRSLANSGASGLLEIVTPAGGGRLSFVAGRCLAAELDGLCGEEAVVALLKQRSGSFRLRLEPWAMAADEGEALPPPPPLPLSRLLLEAVWIEDELKARLKLLPPENRGLRATNGTMPTQPIDLPEMPLGPILTLLHERPSTSLGELVASRLAAPDRLRLAVAWLIESRLVAAV
ncbi:MAG: response regulator [Thermoanaerobaculia bacterium]